MLIGNYSVFNKSPSRFLTGTSMRDRSNWNASGAQRNFYLGDCSNFNTTTSKTPTYPLFTYGLSVGSVPPYSWMIPMKAGGMAMRAVGSNTMTMDLIPQQPTSAAMTGSGTLAADIIAYGNIICALTGSNTFSADITASGNIELSATGSGALTATIRGDGNIIIDFSGSGTLTAEASLIKAMLLDMVGSGTLSADATLYALMTAAMVGDGTLTASITGQKGMAVDFTGTGDLAADMNAFANIILGLVGSGNLEAAISATADMSLDIVVTGTGLTTANVGNAVFAAIASQNNEAGTMGALLNNASTVTLASATAQGGTSNTITLDTGSSSIDDYYNYNIIAITGGTGAGQAAFINDYDGTTKVATVSTPWATVPSASSTFKILPFGNSNIKNMLTTALFVGLK